VFIQLGELLVDLVWLGPNSAIDEILFEVSEVHDRRKILAQLYRVDDREAELAGWRGSQEPENDIV